MEVEIEEYEKTLEENKKFIAQLNQSISILDAQLREERSEKAALIEKV